MKTFIRVILIAFFLLITFFGLGPVLMADGVLPERLFTLVVVVALYAIVILVWKKLK